MEFTQAVWAEMTDDYVCARHYPHSDLWRGPVRGALVTEMTILFDALENQVLQLVVMQHPGLCPAYCFCSHRLNSPVTKVGGLPLLCPICL